jgi:RNA polymerase sigma-70 factor (ECF subfamily)
MTLFFFVNPFKDKVSRLAKVLLVSTEEAEDATQEVLLNSWNRNGNLSDFGRLSAMTMTKNYCLDSA